MIPKFRAWDERAGLTEVISIDFLEKKLKVSHWEYGVSNYFSLDDVIVMQSTGLRDKNGVERFVGDCLIKNI
ncbi:YopX family protein [Enterococcus gilvus]|uniref:YopX family protein n=1 Tax=Enterococcus gilvus TaxID=160453 RepID=UPI003D6C00AE